jgi:hypothetical protein
MCASTSARTIPRTFRWIEKKLACAAKDGVARNGSKLGHRGPSLAHFELGCL